MATFEAVNNDTINAVQGDIVKSSLQPYGVTRAVATSASLALVGVWLDSPNIGRVGLVKDDLVEVSGVMAKKVASTCAL